MNLASIFTDHMVLQRNKPIRIWGTSEGPVTVTLNGVTVTGTVHDGTWMVVFPAMEAGGPYHMTIQGDGTSVTLSDILVGEVWLAAGQSNMEHPLMAAEGGLAAAAAASNPNIRLFTVPHFNRPGETCYRWLFEPVLIQDTPWQICTEEAALHFSAIGYFFGAQLQEMLQIPVGIISCNQGATNVETWLPAETVANDPRLDVARNTMDEILSALDLDEYENNYRNFRRIMNVQCATIDAVTAVRSLPLMEYHLHVGPRPLAWNDMLPGPYSVHWPSLYYQNMLNRIIPYAVKGVLWYQGESNAADHAIHHNYFDLFSVLVEQWRKKWNDELPFLTVQLAPFDHAEKDIWIPLINAQIKAASQLKDVYMITSSDLGERHNIHPLRKKDFADRLFLAAQRTVYGMDVAYSGPVFHSAQRQGSCVRITFDHAQSGLVCSGQVAELQLCGEDGIFHQAQSRIEGNTLLAWCGAVPYPTQVQLGNSNFFQLNLYNGSGFIAAPFIANVTF